MRTTAPRSCVSGKHLLGDLVASRLIGTLRVDIRRGEGDLHVLVCRNTKINLLPFFEKAGMLKPINAYIEDYGAGWNIITAKMIDNLKKYVVKLCHLLKGEHFGHRVRNLIDKMFFHVLWI